MTKPLKPSPSSSPYKDKTKLHLAGASPAAVLIPLLDFTNPLWKSMAIYAATDAVGFVISVVTRSHVHLDLIGTGAFAVASLSHLFFGLGGMPVMTLSQKVSSIAVSLWALKLAFFLLFRATRVGHDLRLEDTLSTMDGMFGFWFITFLWNALCSMPYLLGLLSSKSDPIYVLVGSLVFGVGLMIETTADAQKWFFKQSHPPGQFCNVGLWAMSQHPNFLGNLVLWAGILIMNLPAFLPPPLLLGTSSLSSSSSSLSFLAQLWSYRRLGLALLSPLFMWGLLIGQAQGMVTNATQLAASKYGNDPAYQKYIEEVPAIIPKLW